MSLTVQIIAYLFGALLMFAGIMHLIKPQIFKHFIPAIFPKKTVNYIIGIIEFALGLGLFIHQTQKESALGVFGLMLFFLPIHIWDATKARPAIGSKKMAYFRIPLQFVLLYFAYLIYIES
ncbi:hypothetical protein GCM10011416_03370 [Polaribacter pacificus]|uniref:Methylamine utilisation protein MauE domain-containing protein n=1 Tax=Polaribacter pacificus TaxID=1775173 RepID=A0A917HUX8_9FLAO|nr:MauE/DoxX family redox-associated membrane protein [Polaribacter pacificus]GGG90117.1 hypothetical protein GCM10011416_03370 [Polaribacter pacificus]